VLLVEDAVRIGGEAVVGGHDGQPPDPDVDRELDDLLLLVPLVAADALDGGQLLSRDVAVFLEGGDRPGRPCGSLDPGAGVPSGASDGRGRASASDLGQGSLASQHLVAEEGQGTHNQEYDEFTCGRQACGFLFSHGGPP